MAPKSQFQGDYRGFFSDATGFDPYNWQSCVAHDGLPDVLPIPTGLGKTEGAVLAWAWRRLCAGLDEPLHLVYCLPMRALVRQTAERLKTCFERLANRHGVQQVPVYFLMGGAMDEQWVSEVDKPWVLVGTQDQLLSRALNRGYSMSRFEWPMHFGLLNQDCRWIVDETQLMGPGLWTTSQLDWMRRKRFPSLKPCRTTWMSATVGTAFLATTDRKRDAIHEAQTFDPKFVRNKNEELDRRLFDRCVVLEWFKPSSGKRAPGLYRQIASRVVEEHGQGTLSLVVSNTVKSAQELFDALPDGIPKILLTSRFRPADRKHFEQRLVGFEKRRTESGAAQLDSDPGLICVSTQVVEAGIDISCRRLWSELAPWPSMMQRLGRLNRDGRDNESARARFWQAPKEAEKNWDGEVRIGPYLKRDLQLAKALIDTIVPLSSGMPFVDAVEGLREQQPERLRSSLEPELAPLPRAIDVHGLFSTEPDLHGGFTDVSRFVRNTDPDADLIVFWRVWPGPRPPRGEALIGPPFDANTEGCPVAFYEVRDFLRSQRARAWVWNDDDELWEICPRNDLRPGMVVMLHRDVGGYTNDIGWTGSPAHVLQDAPAAGPGRALFEDERTEADEYVPLDVHLADVEAEAASICDALDIIGDLRRALLNAARFHDIGKAHPKWQLRLPAGSTIRSGPWAKSPHVFAMDVASLVGAYPDSMKLLRSDSFQLPPLRSSRGGLRLRWVVSQKLKRAEVQELRGLQGVQWAGHVPFRPSIRHEAASALAMSAHYRQNEARYPALAVYLVAAHHGKVRTVLRCATREGNEVFGVPFQPDALSIDGQVWPMDFSIAVDGAVGEWTSNGFVLNDYGWTGLVSDLLGPWRDQDADQMEVGAVPSGEPRRLGPFALAWLEAIMRVADWRASAHPSRTVSITEAHDAE